MALDGIEDLTEPADAIFAGFVWLLTRHCHNIRTPSRGWMKAEVNEAACQAMGSLQASALRVPSADYPTRVACSHSSQAGFKSRIP